MTATLTPRFDNAAFGCGRAQIRAHYRHLATVVTITGLIDNVNVDAVTAYTQRFILAKDPLILDLGEVRISATDALTLLRTLAQDCPGPPGWNAWWWPPARWQSWPATMTSRSRVRCTRRCTISPTRSTRAVGCFCR